MPRTVFAGIVLLSLALVARFSSASGEELLTNNGFESGVSPWSATFGQLDAVSSPVHSGAGAARLSSSALQSHDVYRSVAVAPGQPYNFSGWLYLNDPAVERAFLRVTWFDAGGGLVSQADSPWLTIPSPEYQSVGTGVMTSPLAATWARIGVRVQASSQFNIYFDDLSFNGTAAPSPGPETPQPTHGPTPTAAPAPATRTPRPATPTATPKVTPQVDQEPAVFAALTNGGFEIARPNGSPYAWKDIGAELRVTEAFKFEGSRALSMVSRSSSTKWAYQTVAVQPGAFYVASGYTLNGAPGGETFLRVSWYTSDDGSGSAIDSADSTEVAMPTSGFVLITTGPIEAPPEARTAKVRLMLRPGSDSPATSYFDALSFVPTNAPAESAPSHAARGPASRGGSGGSSGTSAGDGTAVEPLVARPPLGFANVQPQSVPEAAAPASGSNYDWLAALGIAIGGAAIAFAAATELSRRRREGDREE